MNVITLICIVIITISVLSIVYIAYSLLRVIETSGIYDIGRMMKETMQSLVLIILFFIILSFTAEILLKYRDRPSVKFELKE